MDPMTGSAFGFPSDPMPASLRIQFESEQRRLDALADKLDHLDPKSFDRTLAAIRALPESSVLDWDTEPGEYLR